MTTDKEFHTGDHISFTHFLYGDGKNPVDAIVLRVEDEFLTVGLCGSATQLFRGPLSLFSNHQQPKTTAKSILESIVKDINELLSSGSQEITLEFSPGNIILRGFMTFRENYSPTYPSSEEEACKRILKSIAIHSLLGIFP